jgi:hypothetical protein
MERVVLVTLNDGLMLPSGFVSQATYECAIFCRVPDEWVANDSLRTEFEALIPEFLYGKHFRNGNDDGSRYVYQNLRSKTLTPEEVSGKIWEQVQNSKERRYWYCHAFPAANEFQSVEKSLF